MSDDTQTEPTVTSQTEAVANLLLGPEEDAEASEQEQESEAPAEPADSRAADDEPKADDEATEEREEEDAKDAEPKPQRWTPRRIQEMKAEDFTPETIQEIVPWIHKNVGKWEAQERRTKQAQRKLETERKTFVDARDSHIRDVSVLRDKNQSVERRFHALAQIAKDDPATLFEELVVTMAGGEIRKGKDSAGLSREDVERLVSERLEQAQQQQRETQSTAEAFEQQIAQGILDETEFPFLAERAAEIGAEQAIAGLMRIANHELQKNGGTPVTSRYILTLADQAEARAARGRKPTPSPGNDGAKSDARADSPKRAARTVPANLADAPPTAPKQLSRKEHLERIANLFDS